MGLITAPVSALATGVGLCLQCYWGSMCPASHQAWGFAVGNPARVQTAPAANPITSGRVPAPDVVRGLPVVAALILPLAVI